MHYLGVVTLEELVDRYLVHGDESAVEAVVRRTQPRLLRTARGIWPADADDCVQTAYLSLMHKRGSGLDAPVVPWLITAVVRTAYRHRAQSKRRDEIAAQLGWAKGAGDPVRGAIDAEEARRLRCHVDRLPAKLRDAVVLHYLEELPTRETAFLLGITEANVRVRLQRARALLRTRLPVRFGAAICALPWMLVDARDAVAGGIALKAAAATIALAVVGFLMATGGSREPRRTDLSRALVTAPAPSAPAEVPERHEVTGRVVDPEGAPVRGALVTAGSEARTDIDGRFACDFGGSVLVEATGLAPAVRRGVQPGEDLEIRLERGAALTGIVMGIDRAPVAGAMVRWQSPEFSRVTRSGTDGRYRLDALPSAQAVAIVEADAFAPVVTPVAAGVEQNFVLVAGATLRGTVVDDATGRPVANAHVRLWPVRYREPTETRTAADGSFTFLHVPSGGFHNSTMQEYCRIGAWAPGRVSRAPQTPFALSGGTSHIELRLYRAIEVTGTVVDADRVPRAGVSVSLQKSHWPRHGNVASRTDGTFLFDRVPDVPGLIVAVRGDRKDAGRDVVLVAPALPSADFLVVDEGGRPIAGALVGRTHTDRHGRCRVELPETRTLVSARGFAPVRAEAGRVVLGPGYPLTGVVRWSDGLPACAGVVLARDGAVTLASARIAEDGTFAFENLPPGPPELVALWQTWLNAPTSSNSVGARGPELVFPGPRPSVTRCEVKGTIRDAGTGALVPFFRAYVRNCTVRAVAPGEWAIGPLDAGTYEWFLMSQGYARHDGTFTIEPGQQELRLDVEIGHASTVRGVITGAPAGAKIRLLDETWEWGDEAPIGADGAYEIRNVRPGRHVPVVFLESGKRFDRLAVRDVRVIEVGEGVVVRDLVVVPGARVEIRVADDAANAPLTVHRDGRLVAGAKGPLVDRRLGFSQRGMSAWMLPAGRYVARHGGREERFEVVEGVPMLVNLK